MVLFKKIVESFYFWTALNFEIPAALVFPLEVYYKVDRKLILLYNKLEKLLDGVQIKHDFFKKKINFKLN